MLAKTGIIEEGRELIGRSLAGGLSVGFSFFFFGGGGGCEGAYGNNMVLWDRSVTESLVEVRMKAAGNGISVNGFCEDVSHCGIERLGFGVFSWTFSGCSCGVKHIVYQGICLYQVRYHKWLQGYG